MTYTDMLIGAEIKLVNAYLKGATKADALEWEAASEKTTFFFDFVENWIDGGTCQWETLRDIFEEGMEALLA
tara:strand:- start:600 stop:815 length:216 start_codon:yes stop_codon:yes gene_type:complete